MTYLKITCYTVLSSALLSASTMAYANSYHGGAQTRTSAINGAGSYGQFYSNNQNSGNVADRFFGSSSTATFFYKKGVNNFEKGKLEKAEAAFKASLRANGSKTMDQLTLHYLTHINHQQGNETQAKSYAQTYINLHKK